MSKFFYIPIFLFTILSCDDKGYFFDTKKDIIEIPFSFSKTTYGHIVTKCVVENDTLNFIFDTGADKSLISSINLVKNYRYVGKGVLRDIYNYKKEIDFYKIKRFKWGSVEIKNLNLGEFKVPIEKIDGIIGNDILKNHIVKIDFENRKILMTKNHHLFPKKGIQRDFNPSIFSVKLNDSGAYKGMFFIIDTGFPTDISIDTIRTNNPIKKWIIERKGGFKTFYSKKLTTSSYFIHKVNCDSLCIKNILYEHSIDIQKNIIGNSFLRRFKSVTLDPFYKKAYFEFPKDNHLMKFSGNEINNMSIFSLDNIYSRFVSFGMKISDTPPYVILEKKTSTSYTNIKIGDTLVGIDNSIFVDISDKDKIKRHSYFYEMDTEKQRKILYETFHRKKEATFHFLKKGELLSFRSKRDISLSFLPTMAYGFNDENIDYLNSGAINYSKEKLSNFSIHLPWSTLSGGKMSISVFKNGKKKEFTNEPK